MAGLLDYINKGGQYLDGLMQRLVTPDVVADPAMLEMMTPEQRAAATRAARSAGIAGLQKGAQAGLPWYAMNSAQTQHAQPVYNQYVDQAVASVEELRKRREASTRRESVAELVKRITSGEDPLSAEYTPEQLAVLPALTPDEQAALLAKSAFPKESGINIATAGTIQQTRKLANGNIGVVVQTGDPKNPVKIVDTGEPYISELPSDIRSLQELMQNPELLAIIAEKAKQDSTGKKTGEANVDAQVALPGLIATNERHIQSLEELRDQISELPTNALTGPVLSLFSSRFQTAQAALYEEALQNIAALAQAGVKLNPLTEKEVEILFTTSPKLTNKPEANVQIINERINRIRKVTASLREQLAVIDSGRNITEWRPGQPAPRTEPVPMPATTPGSVANPPPGGPGSVSTIPTIKRP
jgi:hypothetical protein